MKTNTTHIAWTAALACIVLASFASVHAAPIIWGTATTIGTNGDADIRTDGTLVGAFTVGNSASGATVNGVAFTPVHVSGAYNDYANPIATFGSVATLAGNNSLYGTTWPSENATAGNPALSTAYQTMLQTGVIPVLTSGTFTLTLQNLTIGNEYLFQTWVQDGRFANGARTQTLTGGANTSGSLNFSNSVGNGNGSFIVGSFTADAATQAITYTAVTGGTAQINAFQLREMAVPEPATWIMIAGGLAGCYLLRRRRSS